MHSNLDTMIIPSEPELDATIIMPIQLKHSNTLPTVKSSSNISDMSGDVTVATEVSDSVSSKSSHVSFGPIHVREYERIVGDHPDTRVGVPLAIGWAFYEKPAMSVDDYEKERVPKGILRMSSITRKNILHNVFGIPEEELRLAEKEVQKIKKLRQQSAKQSNVSARTESAFRSLGRKVRRALSTEHLMQGISVVGSSMMMPLPQYQ